MYVCPRTRGPLHNWRSVQAGVTYPVIEGLPILAPEPFRLTARRRAFTAVPLEEARAPDAVTPHLPANLLGAPGGLGQWFSQLQDGTSDAVAAALASRIAPPGAALDVGCGLAPMARRMVALGRATWAFDCDLEVVVTARNVLCGQTPVATIPTHKAAFRRVKVPFRPITEGLSFCVADAASPPFAPGSFAWVHLGDVLDHCGDAVGEVLVGSAELVGRGGVITITTSYSAPHTISENRPPPEDELLEALEGLGFQVMEQGDRVPHILRQYDRSYLIRFMHVIVARRRG